MILWKLCLKDTLRSICLENAVDIILKDIAQLENNMYQVSDTLFHKLLIKVDEVECCFCIWLYTNTVDGNIKIYKNYNSGQKTTVYAKNIEKWLTEKYNCDSEIQKRRAIEQIGLLLVQILVIGNIRNSNSYAEK